MRSGRTSLAGSVVVDIHTTNVEIDEAIARGLGALRLFDIVLVDANIIGIYFWEAEGRILDANDEFLRIVGYDREDLASGRLSWIEISPPELPLRHQIIGQPSELKASPVISKERARFMPR